MVVSIRLARGGAKKKAHYYIVVANSRSPRDGRFIEKLGFYHPLADEAKEERFRVDADKVKSWMAKGAQPSDRVLKILEILGIVEKKRVRNNPIKAIPKKERKKKA